MSRSRAVLLVLGAVVLSVLGEALVLADHAEHHGAFFNSVPLWDLAFAGAGGALLIAFAKRVAKPLVARPEEEPPGSRGGGSRREASGR